MIDTDPQEFAEELRNEPTVNLFTSTKQLQKVNLENIVEISTYSSLYKLLRITGLIVRFRDNLKLCPLKNLDELKYGEVSTEEVHTAECLWIRSIQESLSNEKNYDQLHAQLGLFRDGDGTVRCRGRIEKFPAFLPRNHPLTTIIIRQCHQDVFHNGLKSSLNELRPKFWITKARHHVKSVLRNCTICRRYEAKPYVYRSTQRAVLQKSCSTVGILLGKLIQFMCCWQNKIHLLGDFLENFLLSGHHRPRSGENFYKNFGQSLKIC